MKKLLLMVIALMAGMEALAQGIRVNYSGPKPTIADFVTAYLSQEDDEEIIRGIREDWSRRQSGRALSNGAAFTVDEKNGFVRYDKRYTGNTYSYTELCYWNCKDGKHKLLAVNRGCIEEGRPVTAQFTGLKFYTYDNQTKRMRQTLNSELGASIDVRPEVTYALPQAGKDIMATIHAQQGEVHNREYALIEAHGTEGVVFEDCRFFANWGDAPLFSLDRLFTLLGCVIYHPTENLGTMNLCEQPGAKNWFSENPLDPNIQDREIGPDGHYANARGE